MAETSTEQSLDELREAMLRVGKSEERARRHLTCSDERLGQISERVQQALAALSRAQGIRDRAHEEHVRVLTRMHEAEAAYYEAFAALDQGGDAGDG